LRTHVQRQDWHDFLLLEALADRVVLHDQEESLTVYTGGFRAYDPLEDDDDYNREYVVHGDGEYVDGDVHVNGRESHASPARR